MLSGLSMTQVSSLKSMLPSSVRASSLSPSARRTIRSGGIVVSMFYLTVTTITSLTVKILVQTTLTVMTMAFATTKNQLLNV